MARLRAWCALLLLVPASLLTSALGYHIDGAVAPGPPAPDALTSADWALGNGNVLLCEGEGAADDRQGALLPAFPSPHAGVGGLCTTGRNDATGEAKPTSAPPAGTYTRLDLCDATTLGRNGAAGPHAAGGASCVAGTSLSATGPGLPGRTDQHGFQAELGVFSCFVPTALPEGSLMPGFASLDYALYYDEAYAWWSHDGDGAYTPGDAPGAPHSGDGAGGLSDNEDAWRGHASIFLDPALSAPGASAVGSAETVAVAATDLPPLSDNASLAIGGVDNGCGAPACAAGAANCTAPANPVFRAVNLDNAEAARLRPPWPGNLQMARACPCCLVLDLATQGEADSAVGWRLQRIPSGTGDYPAPQVALVPSDWVQFAGADWISFTGTHVGPPGTYEYVLNFTVPDRCFDEAELELTFSADASVRIFLDGSTTPLADIPAPAYAGAHFVGATVGPGAHSIVAEVTSGPGGNLARTGFLAKGELRAGVEQSLVHLSTGVSDAIGNPLLPAFAADDTWRLASAPNNCCGPAVFVIDQPIWTYTSLPGAQWIGPDPDGQPTNGVSLTVPYVYEAVVTVPPCAWEAGAPKLYLNFTADNRVEMRLDGNLLARRGWDINNNPTNDAHFGITSYAGTLPASGTHVLSAVVWNISTYTGLLVEVDIVYDAECPCGVQILPPTKVPTDIPF